MAVQLAPSAPTYVINRSFSSTPYSIWRLDLSNPALLTYVPSTNTYYPPANHLVAVGGYLLSYTPPGPSGGESLQLGYSLIPFDPDISNPLLTGPVQSGVWPWSKFQGFYDHYTWDPLDTDYLQLISITGYVLAFMPTSARATFQLWNFDPAPTAPNTVDPLPAATDQADAFSLIALGSQLLPMGSNVLEWIPATQAFRLWSFDPQEATPLATPVLGAGTFESIDATHRLLALGDFILDWVPATGAYRLWAFDPTRANPLVGPVAAGQLPPEFTSDSNLTAIQTPVAIDPTLANTPGTMDFFRDKIEHVVVYMLESRSFDSVLGWLYGANPAGVNWVNAAPPFACTSLDYSNQANGQTWNVYPFMNGVLSTSYDLTAPVIDPFHGTPDSIHQQYSAGYAAYQAAATPDMGGFVANNASGSVMVTLTPMQLPVLNGLAAAFAVSDAWFSALPGGTDSNRAFALTGSSFDITATVEGPPQYYDFPDATHRQSIFKSLWINGITDWKIYWSVLWYDNVFTYQLYLKGEIPTVDANVTTYVQQMPQFFTDAANGTLPKFSFLEPFWIAPSGATSYHPGGDLVPAEVYLNQIYQAIANGPGWEKTALIITFSKGGGLYDHVPPPRTINPWPNDSNDGFDYDVLGPRVPTIVVSPYVNANTVFRSPGTQPFSHTSLTASLMSWFGVPKPRWGLGDRVDQENTIEAVFQRAAPRTDIPAFPNPYDKTYPPGSDNQER